MGARQNLSWQKAVALAVGVTALCQVVYHGSGTGGRILSLDREVSLSGGPSEWTIPIPALISCATLVCAAWLWRRARAVLRGADRSAGSVLACFLVFMAVDELLGIHEQVGHLLRVKWLVAYAPIILIAGIGALFLVARLWPTARPAAQLLFLGGTCWAIAQVLEILEWNGEQHVARGYTAMMTAEELLETLGSGLFGLAAVWLLKHHTDGPTPTTPAGEGRHLVAS